MTDEELRKRGIEFLLSQRKEDKKRYELSAKELAPVLNVVQSSVYEHMEPLVKAGLWGTRDAFDPETHHTIKVWWLIE